MVIDLIQEEAGVIYAGSQELAFEVMPYLDEVADYYNVPISVLEKYVRDRGIPVEGNVIPLENARLFGAALSFYDRYYFSQEKAARKLGGYERLNELTAQGKVRFRSYHGLMFYFGEDVTREAKNLRRSRNVQCRASTHRSASVKFKRGDLSLLPILSGDELIDLWEVAHIWHCSRKAARTWIFEWQLATPIPLKIHKTRWHFRRFEILAVLELSFFKEEQWEIEELAHLLHLTAVTVNRWQRLGFIKVSHSPGGKTHIPQNQLGLCLELAMQGHKTKKHLSA